MHLISKNIFYQYLLFILHKVYIFAAVLILTFIYYKKQEI